MAKTNKKKARTSSKKKKKGITRASETSDNVRPTPPVAYVDWDVIWNAPGHALFTMQFKRELLLGGTSKSLPMLFRHSEEEEALPTMIAITYDDEDDGLYAQPLGRDMFPCDPGLVPRDLFTLELVENTEQHFWLRNFFREEEFWEKDEFFWEEAFGLNTKDMDSFRQDYLRLVLHGEIEAAMQIGHEMAFLLLSHASADHILVEEEDWCRDEVTGERISPAMAFLPHAKEIFDEQRRKYIIRDPSSRRQQAIQNAKMEVAAHEHTGLHAETAADDEDCAVDQKELAAEANGEGPYARSLGFDSITAANDSQNNHGETLEYEDHARVLKEPDQIDRTRPLPVIPSTAGMSIAKGGSLLRGIPRNHMDAMNAMDADVTSPALEEDILANLPILIQFPLPDTAKHEKGSTNNGKTSPSSSNAKKKKVKKAKKSSQPANDEIKTIEDHAVNALNVTRTGSTVIDLFTPPDSNRGDDTPVEKPIEGVTAAAKKKNKPRKKKKPSNNAIGSPNKTPFANPNAAVTRLSTADLLKGVELGLDFSAGSKIMTLLNDLAAGKRLEGFTDPKSEFGRKCSRVAASVTGEDPLEWRTVAVLGLRQMMETLTEVAMKYGEQTAERACVLYGIDGPWTIV